MPLQARPDTPGHDAQTVETFAAVPAFDFVGHVDVCGFAAAVGGPGTVIAVVEIVVADLDGACAMAGRGEVDDARVEIRGRGGEEGGLEELEE